MSKLTNKIPKCFFSVVRPNYKAKLLKLVILSILLLGNHGLQAFPKYLDVSSLDGTNGFSISGKFAAAHLGYCVSKIGDLNGDGFDDVAVSGTNTYEVFVIFGKASGFPADLNLAAPGALDGIHGFTIGFNGAETGLVIGGGGDVNGDGVDDMIVGSPLWTEQGGTTGRACVIFGRKNSPFPSYLHVSQLIGSNGFVFEGNTTVSGKCGFSVAIAKDINGDGLDDIVVGAPFDAGEDMNGANDPAGLDGRAYVIMGKSNFPAVISAGNLSGLGFSFSKSQNYIFSPDDSFYEIGMQLGWSVSGAGDVNGDGFNDLLIGAPRQHGFFQNEYGGEEFTGVTYILFGNPELPNGPVEDIFIQGRTGTDEMGTCVSGAGDVNGDGIDDFLTSSPLATYDANIEIPGESYLLLGQPNLKDNNLHLQLGIYPNVTNGVMINSTGWAEGSGQCVSGLGDINGDGLDDVIIGSPETSHENGTWSGEAWVIYGRKEPFPTLGGFDPGYLPFLGKWGAWESVPGAGFRIGADLGMGWSVRGAGDVNGDGLEDIIIGSPEADVPGKPQAGRAYVIFGHVIDPGDIDGDGNVDLILQNGVRVYAALMKNGVYSGVKKSLITLPSAEEKVVAVNDFDLDGITDLATQQGVVINIRKGPTYAIASTFNLKANIFNPAPQVVASGNVQGSQTKGKLGYPDLIVCSTMLDIRGNSTSYCVYVNEGNGTFGTPQSFYTLANDNYLVGCGKFLGLAQAIMPNQFSDVLMQKINLPGQKVYAYPAINLNGAGQFLSSMSSAVLGAANFKGGAGYEIIGVDNANGVTIGTPPVFSGYTLSSGEKVVGPK